MYMERAAWRAHLNLQPTLLEAFLCERDGLRQLGFEREECARLEHFQRAVSAHNAPRLCRGCFSVARKAHPLACTRCKQVYFCTSACKARCHHNECELLRDHGVRPPHRAQ
jgi:hypothetical protein